MPPHIWVDSMVSDGCQKGNMIRAGSRHTLVQPGDETKVARAALESLPKVGILLGVGVDDGAIAEDDLEVGDVVRGKAFGEGMEGVLRHHMSTIWGPSTETDRVLTPPPVVKPPTPTTDARPPTDVRPDLARLLKRVSHVAPGPMLASLVSGS